MASPFNGRWSLTGVENVIPYLDAIGSPEEHKEKLKEHGEAIKSDPNYYYEDIQVSGDTFHRQCWINGEKKKDSGDVPFNKEFDGQILDGRKSKVKIVKDGDKIVRTDDVAGMHLTSTFAVSGDELTLTITNGTVTTTEKYKRIG